MTQRPRRAWPASTCATTWASKPQLPLCVGWKRQHSEHNRAVDVRRRQRPHAKLEIVSNQYFVDHGSDGVGRSKTSCPGRAAGRGRGQDGQRFVRVEGGQGTGRPQGIVRFCGRFVVAARPVEKEGCISCDPPPFCAQKRGLGERNGWAGRIRTCNLLIQSPIRSISQGRARCRQGLFALDIPYRHVAEARQKSPRRAALVRLLCASPVSRVYRNRDVAGRVR